LTSRFPKIPTSNKKEGEKNTQEGNTDEIPACFWRESLSLVILDIFNQESIWKLFGWIPATNMRV
jgi:hypothetical protein